MFHCSVLFDLQTQSLFNVMGLVPVLVIALVCLIVLIWITYSFSKNIAEWPRVVVVTILTHLPIGSSQATRGRRLIYIFVIFIIVWGVWTARFSLHGWDSKTG